jgi:hypothetical protein
MLIQTAEDWKRIRDTITIYRPVNLLVDGYKITVKKVFVSETKAAYFIFVNGEFRGKWGLEDCEERRRFFYRYERYVNRPAYRRQLILMEKKSKGLFKPVDVNKKNEYFTPFFPNFRALQKHLGKYNEKIEWNGE